MKCTYNVGPRPELEITISAEQPALGDIEAGVNHEKRGTQTKRKLLYGREGIWDEAGNPSL